MEKISNKVSLKISLTLMLIFSFSTIGFGQNEEQLSVMIPEKTMAQVVKRILIYSFKPEKKPKVIYLAKQIHDSENEIKNDWLPEIKNIEFQLLSKEEIRQKKIKIHFFTKPERNGKKIEIGFAFGIPDCEFDGDTWCFRFLKESVNFWIDSGFSGFCYTKAVG